MNEERFITIEPSYAVGFGAKATYDGREVWSMLDGLLAAKAGLRIATRSASDGP